MPNEIFTNFYNSISYFLSTKMYNLNEQAKIHANFYRGGLELSIYLRVTDRWVNTMRQVLILYFETPSNIH